MQIIGTSKFMNVAILQSTFDGFFPRFYHSILETLDYENDSIAVFGNRNIQNSRMAMPNKVLFGSRFNWHIHYFLYKITGIREVFSFSDTFDLIFRLKQFKPDIIHLNVINGCIINMPLLTWYINHYKIPVVWTMHDCRAFTAFCPYPDEIGCEQWKVGCKKCPVRNTIIKNPNLQWKINCYLHAGIKNLTIVTPSRWLAGFVRESFLRSHPTRVIYNGVDTSVFSTPSSFDVHRKYNIAEEKKIVLGCAINWEARKGLHFFELLADILPSDYQIVLVGGIDENRRDRLKRIGIICTGYTSTLDEMVACYQSASVFCNPTLADNFPTTNIEALAAGTPIVTFRTGGSSEALDDKTGIVVEQGNIQALSEAVQRICEHRDYYTSNACRSRSQMFSMRQYDEYVKLYKSLI